MLWSLFLLAVSGFTSATILPGNSEVAFLLYLNYYPNSWFIALCVVSFANTLGSMSSYLITYFIPSQKFSTKYVEYVKKYGSPLLFFSFVPIIGDALPLIAGWLKLSTFWCIFFIALGKITRYCIILAGFILFNS
ncbi:MAG: DedA family protein [Alphaproteobacteria bacterium]|jgi:membrane protein YqaA with SNARE-associated domain|nr:DedA family protein [Alphaproteobacteria bacterium]